MKILYYNISPCMAGGFTYQCILDTAYACQVVVNCGLNCETGECIACSATWDPATCTCSNDRDNDGYTPDEGDCDDNNPNVHPDVDRDGDGVDVCEDCQDRDDTIYPGAPENCTDGVDNNCNGLIDGQDPECGGDGNCGDTQEEIDCRLYAGIWDENFCRCDYTTPILIDTEGNGFDLTKAGSGVNFDLKPDGFAERIAWTTAGSDEVFLVLDRNGNGLVDNGTELFGNFTPQPASAKPNGFIALAEFNKPANGGNGDSKISHQDRIFSSLRLWKDVNHNGISEPNELYSMPSLNVSSLDLTYRESRRRDRHGNVFRYRAKVHGPQGSDPGRWAYDVFLIRAQ